MFATESNGQGDFLTFSVLFTGQPASPFSMGPEFLVTKEELRKAFKRLGSGNKALGPDGILGGVIAKTANFFLAD